MRFFGWCVFWQFRGSRDLICICCLRSLAKGLVEFVDLPGSAFASSFEFGFLLLFNSSHLLSLMYFFLSLNFLWTVKSGYNCDETPG
jgi:hypothetical protein